VTQVHKIVSDHTPTRVVLIEDRPAQAFEVLKALRPIGSVFGQRVDREKQFVRTLQTGVWAAVVIGSASVRAACRWLAVDELQSRNIPTLVVLDAAAWTPGLRIEGASAVISSATLSDLAREVSEMIRLAEMTRRLVQTRVQLEQLQNLVSAISTMLPVSVFSWPLAEENVVFTPSLGDLVNDPKIRALTKGVELFDFLHAEDVNRVSAAVGTVLTGEAGQVEMSLRLIVTDGRIVRLRVRVIACPDSSGRVTKLSGAVTYDGLRAPEVKTERVAPGLNPSARRTNRLSAQQLAPADRTRVMLVEDEDLVRRLAVMVLTDDGFEVDAFEDAASALEAWDRHQPPHLLLTDIVMPGMSGPQFVATVRAEVPSQPVLYMSGFSPDDLLAQGVDADHANVLHKPYTASELSQRVRAAVDAA
jgi:CheY-like chemotaxis protein